MTVDAITRRRHVVYGFAGCSHPVVTCRTRQPVVYAAGIQRRVVEARNKSAACLMALLTQVRRRRVRRAFADRSSRVARDVAADARLGFDGRILVVDRIGFQEIAGRRVARIAFPAVGVDGGMHGITWMGPRAIGRIVVRAVVASAATCCVRGMYRIHERICSGKATCDRPIDAGTVGRIRVTGTAISRRRDVSSRSFDHDHTIVRFAVVTTGAVVRDACGGMVERRQCETAEPGVMAHQTILPRCR